jgi:hypothetical protein
VRYRSLIFPAVLILAGVLALLVDTGAIAADRLILLVNLWPLVLIVIGVELIIRRAVQGAAADVAAAVVIVVAIVAAAAYVAVSPNPTGTNTADLSSPVGDLHQASLELDFGSATVDITSAADLGSVLYRAHIEFPNPGLDRSFDSTTGAVKISQRTGVPFGFHSGHVNANIQLNPDVTWTITENTGASTDTVNIPQVKVSAITINTGASREDLTLGPPSGIVPVEVHGGALTVHLHRPSAAEAAVEVSGGAVSLDADGHQQHGIGDLRYQSSGFGGAADGYRFRVSGGACTVVLDTAA